MEFLKPLSVVDFQPRLLRPLFYHVFRYKTSQLNFSVPLAEQARVCVQDAPKALDPVQQHTSLRARGEIHFHLVIVVATEISVPFLCDVVDGLPFDLTGRVVPSSSVWHVLYVQVGCEDLSVERISIMSLWPLEKRR